MKHYIKTGFSVLLFMTFLVFAIASSDETEEVSTVSEANELTDEKFEEFDKKYEELCKKKRNDKLKGSFGTLGREIKSYGKSISEAENLDYDEQSKARKYYDKKLDGNHNLKQLTRSQIECW